MSQILIDENTGKPINFGDEVETFRGERGVITGGTPPHKPESTGRVYVKLYPEGETSFPKGDRTHEDSFFPGVIGAKWVDKKEHAQKMAKANN